jgi:tellurite resistance protein TerC
LAHIPLPVEPLHWAGFGVLVVALLVLDLAVFHRHVHTPTLRESAGWSVFWIALGLIFNGVIWWWGWREHHDPHAGLDFLTAFLVEKSLSMDNLFVFAVIFRFFGVELKYQYRVLFWGILGAILLRLAFILAGVELIHRFELLLVGFGVFLMWSAYKLAKTRDSEVHPEKNIVLRTARRFLSVSREDHGERFFVRENGRRCITPLFLVLLVVESTDVVFAVDSVPAVIGITLDTFVVFTSNVFAILGLRALYFLLAGVMDRFRYVHYGLSAVLGFIGLKMIAEYAAKKWTGREDLDLIPSWLSLLVVAALLAISMVASVVATRREQRRGEQARDVTT